MAEMFPTRMRYSGVSLGSQVTSIFAGSLAPLLAAQLLKDTGSWVPIAIYLVVACAITTVAVSEPAGDQGHRPEDVAADAARGGVGRPASARGRVRDDRTDRTRRTGHRRRQRNRCGVRPGARRPRCEGGGRRRRRAGGQALADEVGGTPGPWTCWTSDALGTLSSRLRHPGEQRRDPAHQPDRGVRSGGVPADPAPSCWRRRSC